MANRILVLVAIAAAQVGCGGGGDDVPLASDAALPTVATAPARLPQPRAAEADSGAALQARIEALQLAVDRLQRRLDALEPVLVRAANPATGAGAPHEDEAARFGSVDAAFAQEVVEQGWSLSMADRLRTAVGRSAPALAGQLRSVECRSSTCRIEISASAGSTVARQLQLVASLFAGELPNAVSRVQDDAGRPLPSAVVYLSR